MTRLEPSTNAEFDLERFVLAQRDSYQQALAELRAGRKRSHWIWFIFPQLRGLGHSSMSRWYGLESLAEARALLAHPLLGARLQECATAVLAHKQLSATEILGSPDDLKLRSSATLFARASSADSVFHQVIAQFFANVEDDLTLQLLHMATQSHRIDAART